MNLQAIRERLALEEDELIELVDLFVGSTMADLDRLELALHKGDSDQVVKAAHSIKGAAGNLGFQEIHEIAKGIETRGREETLEGTRTAVRAIKERVDGIAEALRAKTRSTVAS